MVVTLSRLFNFLFLVIRFFTPNYLMILAPYLYAIRIFASAKKLCKKPLRCY